MTDREVTSIGREHLYGATVWAFGGCAARVKLWDRPKNFSRFKGGSCA